MSDILPRVALITGASQGIGEAIALRLSDDGLVVVVNDIPAKKEQLSRIVTLLQSKGRSAHAVVADVSSETQVQSMIQEVVDTFGGLDVMVANAGLGRFGSILEAKTDDYDKVMSVNAKGTFLCYKYAAQQMISQGRGGRIIAACSVAGKYGEVHTGIYAMSKFAIRGLTQTCAREWAKYNITVNTYAPGLVRTTMASQDLGAALDISAIPITEPETIGGLVSYLVRPEASFMTGQSLVIDGGQWVCD